MNWKEMLVGTVDLLYPRRCPFCRKNLSVQEKDLCNTCRDKTEQVEAPIEKGQAFTCCHSVFFYKDRVASAIKAFKFSGKSHYGMAFGHLLGEKLMAEGVSADLITWASISTKRKRSRGYDQGEEMAKAVGKIMGIPVRKLLRKVRHTPAQAMITHDVERKRNVLNAYTVTKPEQVAGKRILLLDDVITTGATLSECAKMLHQAGAASIICGTFAAARD